MSGLLCCLWAGSPAIAADDPSGISFTLEGCKIEVGTILPNASGDFICPESQYTTGNLGKNWSELDLVPHRVTVQNKNKTGSQTYAFIVAADYRWTAGSPLGYDVVSALTLNAGKSSASCPAADSGAGFLITPSGGGAGGADQTIYRLITINGQLAETTCVYDYYERLAIGASQFSGASLHSNLLNQSFGTAGIGSKEVSIPVNEVAPQELSKTMGATQDQAHAWLISKTAPAALEFADTCSIDNDARAKPVQVSIQWTKLAAAPDGKVSVGTVILATNPSAREIGVSVEDVIYSGTTPLDTRECTHVLVPPNTTGYEVCTHSVEIDAGQAVDLNDVATASYHDEVTGVPVPGQTTATASATVQPSGNTKNATARIEDSESISGTYLSFSADSFAPALGAFDGYVAGTETTGPVLWKALGLSASGSVTFDKTVYVSEPAFTSGTLSDTADLTGSDGFTASGGASTAITTSAFVNLEIEKSIPYPLETGDPSLTFYFDVVGPDGYSNSGLEITFSAGDPMTKSLTLTGLDPGTYTVTEVEYTALEPVFNPLETTISLPACSGKVSFSNVVPAEEAPRAKAVKVTDPAGYEEGWEFTLDGSDMLAPEIGYTDASGEILFATPLTFDEDYTITETDARIAGTPRSWDFDSYSGECLFTPNFPDDIGHVFTCTAKDVQRGKIIIDKVTIPAGGTGFEFTGDLGTFYLDDASVPAEFDYLLAGTYIVTETDPGQSAYLSDLFCTDIDNTTVSVGTRSATIELDPGETVTCTYTNTYRGDVKVYKTVSGALPVGVSFTFQIRKNASLTSTGTVLATDSTPVQVDSTWLYDFDGFKLDPADGVYSLCEAGMMPGWMTTLTGLPGAFVPGGSLPDPDNSVICVPFDLDPGETEVFEADNTPPPGGDARTIGFWKNWNACSGGNQADVAGPAAANAVGYMLGELVVSNMSCEQIRNVLDKRSFPPYGVKLASDPRYALASQMLAVILNINAPDLSPDGPLAGPSATCPALFDALATAQGLLYNSGFDGQDESKLKGQERKALYGSWDQLLYYAGMFDAYNNNMAGSYCN